jgi:hypothetical protein
VELVPILYAGAFFLIACCGYLCCSLFAKQREFSKQVFVAVLAFGASSYIGFFIVILTISATPLNSFLEGPFARLAYILAYLIPGLAGGWLSLKALRFFLGKYRRLTTAR